MKLHKLKIVTLISFLLVIAFSSCSDHDDHGYWVEGRVDFAIEPVTDRGGDFYERVTLDDSFLRDLNDKWVNPYYITNWRIVDSWNELSNLHIYGGNPIPAILWFDIEVVGIRTYQYRGPVIELLGVNDPFIIDDAAYQKVLSDAIDAIIRYGAVDIIVRGETELRNTNEPIYFDFYNDIDFYVR